MNSKKVISPQNLPTRLPVTFTLVIIMFTKVFAITGAWLGVIITILVIYWILCIFMIGRDKHIDIFSASPKATKADVEAIADGIIEKLNRSMKER